MGLALTTLARGGECQVAAGVNIPVPAQGTPSLLSLLVIDALKRNIFANMISLCL